MKITRNHQWSSDDSSEDGIRGTRIRRRPKHLDDFVKQLDLVCNNVHLWSNVVIRMAECYK